MESSLPLIDVVLCDLDGVMWLAGEPIPGSVPAIEELRSRGCRVVFVTNNSRSLPSDYAEALRSMGVGGREIEVVSSSAAAASLIDRGERVLVVAGPGVLAAVESAGGEIVTITDIGDRGVRSPDAVIVGLDTGFGYETLRVAADAIRSGARFIATNTDPTYPTPYGPVPGAGSIVAAVTTASGVEPLVAGKPNPGMVNVIKNRLGRSFDRRRMIVVGDRSSTDGAFARAIGCRFALVTSGVEEIHDGRGIDPDMVVDDLGSLMIHFGHLFRR